MDDDFDADAVLGIDTDRLIEECVRQPRLYFKFAKESADAKLKHSEAKSQLERTEATVALEIRADPSKHGLEKPTEGAIRAVLVTNNKVKQAEQNLHNAKHLVDLLEALVGGLDHKKRMLELLSKEDRDNFNAAPRLSHPSPEVRDEYEARSDRAAYARGGVKPKNRKA